MKRLLHVIIILAMVCSLSAPAFATTYTWTGGGGAGDTSMDTPANWGGAGHPTTPADTVVFATAVNNVATPSTNNVEQNANVTFNSANDFTVAVNGAHTFGIGDQSNPQGTDGITAQTPDANNRVYTINAPVLIYDSQTWTVSNNGANTTTLAVTGAIGQALGALSLTKAGNGILALSGATANTYSGLTAVNAGELDLGKTAGIDAIAATLTINGGVVKLVNSDQINNASTVTVAGGSLNTNAKSDTVGTLNMSSGSIDGATGTITATTYGLTGGTVNALLGTGAITVNAGTVTLGSAGRLNAGSTLEIDGGQLTLAGAEAVSSYTQTAGTLGGAGNALTAATYSLRGGAVTGNLGLGTVTVTTGTTTLNGTEAGTTVNINSGTLALGGSNKLADGATVTVAGGSLNTGAGLTDTVTAFNMSSGSLLGTGTITAANYGLSGGTVTGNLGAGTVTVTTNTTTLNGTEAGATVNINSGTLALGGIDKLAHGATVTVAGGGILDMNGANTATVNAFNMSSGSLNGTTGTLTAATYGLTGGTVNAMLGAGAITVDTSTVTLGSAGRLNVASTVAVQGGKFMLGGAESAATVTLSNSGALSIGSNTFTLTGAYQQTNTSILNVSVSDLSTIGHISSGAAATVATSGVVNITVPANLYIPANTTYKIVDGISAGSNVNVPGTIGTFGDSRVTFSGSTSSGDLFATSSRSLTGFASLASNSNATTVGNVLDNVLSASSDMTTVLNTLEGLSNSQTATALNSMSPTNDGAVIQSSEAMLNNFTNNTESHLDNMRTTGGVTGVATGDDYLNGIDIWAQGLGDYAHQDPRGSSQGYNATSWGVSGGADKTLYNDQIRVGLGSGYGQTFVRSKDFSGRTDIDSIPATIYCDYTNNNHPYYIDAVFTFIYNMYNGSRQVTAGPTIMRTANADYEGEQYSGYLEGGYSFFYKKLSLTPLASFQYMHLHTGSYTETDAGALNLSVASQDYDMAQTGIGAKLACPFDNKYGTLTPNLHFKWLYDWVGDNQASTASFAGGGTSFGTNGYNAAQSEWDLGARLDFKTKYNITVGVDYDFLCKTDYYEHFGTVDVKYSF